MFTSDNIHNFFLPKPLPEADERLVKGDGRGRLRLLVGEGAGRVCGALLPPPMPGRPPPPTPRGPLRLLPLDELTMAVWKKVKIKLRVYAEALLP